jgi:hypothetical protein
MVQFGAVPGFPGFPLWFSNQLPNCVESYPHIGPRASPFSVFTALPNRVYAVFSITCPLHPQSSSQPACYSETGYPSPEEKGIASSQPWQGPNRSMPARKTHMPSHPRRRLARSDSSAQLGSFRNFAGVPNWVRSATSPESQLGSFRNLARVPNWVRSATSPEPQLGSFRSFARVPKLASFRYLAPPDPRKAPYSRLVEDGNRLFLRKKSRPRGIRADQDACEESG